MKLKIFVVFFLFFQLNCGTSVEKTHAEASTITEAPKVLEVGASRMDLYLPNLQGKKVALVVNQTSVVEGQHLVDTLLDRGIQIVKIFAPEHGFRGKADAGEKIADSKDPETGIPLISLYGKKRKPGAEDLAGIDWLLFDIQDVGARFYTYISTMHYVMEACAEHQVAFMVLDRPNPNGHYVDGPVLAPNYSSFVGMHPIPVVHGMTIGEYAQMINGEAWLEGGIRCELKVIPCANYDHNTFYDLPIKPSPNLPNIRSIYLYPSLCFFEGTVVSAGRGTTKQFQIYGHPDASMGDYDFTPVSLPGAKYPKHENKRCKGFDLTQLPLDAIRAEGRLNLSYLIDFYQAFPNKETFFLKNKFIDKLAGGKTLREQILDGMSETAIRESWKEGLDAFKATRKQYLLYKDFD